MAFASDKTRQGAAGVSTGGFDIDNSLRFNDDDSAYLSKTWSTSATDGTRATISFWFKRSNMTGNKPIIGTNDAYTTINLNNVDDLYFQVNQTGGGSTPGKQTNAKFRDSSAWYHIVYIFNSNATASSGGGGQQQLWINGVEVTSYSFDQETARPMDTSDKCTYTNNGTTAYIGYSANANTYWDGYIAEVHFIDGQALTPSSFGEFDVNYKHWKPIEYTGTYGNNGFYLPFKHDTTAAGFGVVTYTGSESTQSITGLGFQPDLCWFKSRSGAYDHNIVDSVRGVSPILYPNSTGAEYASTDGLTSFDTDGFTLGTEMGSISNGGHTYVAWCWDMGGSNATNNNGTIQSTVRANSAKGQSVVTYTGDNVSGRTIGHGLSSAPELILCKARAATEPWIVYSSTIGNTKHLHLNTGDASASYTPMWNDTSPSNSVFTVGYDSGTNNTTGMIAYCFHSVAGYSKFGSYSGTGSAGNSVTTGFTPRFLMCKRTDLAEEWIMFDAERNGSPQQFLYANKVNSEGSTDIAKVDFTSTGFTLQGTHELINKSGASYIYMAFADTREALLWADKSGKGNDWVANNIDASDEMLDTPTNNFCTWNSAVKPGYSYLKEGNTLASGTNDFGASSTFAQSSGKWYAEFYCIKTTDANNILIIDAQSFHYNYTSDSFGTEYQVLYYGAGTGYIQNNGTTTQSGVTPWDNGDILGVALDLDNSTVQFYLNGSSEGTAETLNSSASGTWAIHAGGNASTDIICNFGQDSSFAGNVTAGTETDDNGYGSFKYDVPTGFLALCTKNLPDPAVIPSEHFNTVLYAGDGTTSNAITGVGFQPDFVWHSMRSSARARNLFDAVRGLNSLSSSHTGYEGNGLTAAQSGLVSYDSDGVTLAYRSGVNHEVNENTKTGVLWNWYCPTTFSGNTDGDITSSGRKNTDAGFSIVSYTGTGTGSSPTVGHGLGAVPDVVLVKRLDSGAAWALQHSYDTTKYFQLQDIDAEASGAAVFDNVAPTASVFTVNSTNGVVNASGGTYIAYCFRSVEGYSKMGSYIGNGNLTDGTMVHTGFRPAYVMIKRATSTYAWLILDVKRDTYNTTDEFLNADDSSVEWNGVGSYQIDIVSNGFKVRSGSSGLGSTGDTYIYLAFAETPFKYANAR